MGFQFMKQALGETGSSRRFQELLGNDHVGVDIRHRLALFEERRGGGGEGGERFHGLSLNWAVRNETPSDSAASRVVMKALSGALCDIRQVQNLLEKSVEDMKLSQTPEGLVPEISPTGLMTKLT